MPEPMKLLLRVRYAECDAQKVVFNSRYAEFADVAATEFMRSTMGGFDKLIEQGMDNQVVNLNISWQGPAKFDDVIVLRVFVSNVGNSSFILSIEMKNHITQHAICNVEITYVMVDAVKFTKLSINEELKNLLLTGAPDICVNLAGDL